MNSTAGTEVVRAEGLGRSYQRGSEMVRALENVSFTINQGDFLAIVGPSGSGKTTLLNLLGCMDAPSTGRLFLEGREVQQLAEKDRTQIRRYRLGFVFQHFGLVPTLTVAENISLPLTFARRPDSGQVESLLEKVGLAPRRTHYPDQLSGGEMQRVAIARALVNQPALLLADEPTGNLDSATSQEVIDLFKKLNSDGLTVVVVTHNPLLAAVARRQLSLKDGRVVEGLK